MIEKVCCGFGNKKCYYRPECIVCFLKTIFHVVRLKFQGK